MDQQALREMMSGRRGGAAAALLRAGAWPLSKLYAALVRLRRGLYRRGLLRGRKLPVPVISVGNLTTGGTGKTPMVAWVVDQLAKAGRQPAVLLRGYKAGKGKSDEARMLRRHSGVAVLADPDRAAAAGKAIADGADVLVLDDGFQHLALKRDLDIVLADATCPLGYGHVLPRGMLREPPSALADADAIVVTRSDLLAPAQLEAVCDRLGRLAPRASLHRAVHAPVAVVADDGRQLPLAALAGKKTCAFCGVGNPQAFFASAVAAGADVVERIAFNDHAEYPADALERIGQKADAAKAEILLTTEKDRVKIEDSSILPLPLWTIPVEMRLTAGAEALIEKILRAAAR